MHVITKANKAYSQPTLSAILVGLAWHLWGYCDEVALIFGDIVHGRYSVAIVVVGLITNDQKLGHRDPY